MAIGVIGIIAASVGAEREDVAQVPYHIACSSTTRSEIVLPLLDARGEVRGVLDIDSDILGAFDAVDQEELEGLAAVVSKVYV